MSPPTTVTVRVRGAALRVRNMLVRRAIRHLASVRTRLRTSAARNNKFSGIINFREWLGGEGAAHDSGGCRISRVEGRYMTSRREARILRMRSMSCADRRRPHLASSRICRSYQIYAYARKSQCDVQTRRRRLGMRRPCARVRGGPETYSRP